MGGLAGWRIRRDRDRHHSRARRVSHRFRPSLSPFHIMRAIKEGDRGAWLAGTRACFSSPPVPSASPPRLQGTTDMGLLGISSFRDMPASLFVSSSLALGRCSGLVCLPPAPLPSHTHTLARPAKSLKHPLSHISEHSRTRGPFISLPNSNHLSQETRVPTSGIQEQPLTHTTSQPLDAGLLFTEKTLSLIYSLVRNTD